MANHVNSYINVVTISEEGQKVWDDICKKLKGDDGEGVYDHTLGRLFVDNDDDIDWDLMVNQVGSKWAHTDDLHECGMSITSAWSSVDAFVEEVACRIGAVDPSLRIEYTWEDEMPNFLGCAVYDCEGLADRVEIEWEEAVQIMLNDFAELREVWDEEEEEFTDDMELVHEILWEWMGDWQSSQLQGM